MILISFIKRNILLYFRDRISVFFSLLSTLIVLTLMIAFLGQENIDSTIQVLGTGLKYEAVHASSLIIIWTIAGILVVNAVSISMTLVGTMVRDEESGKISAFFVAPVKRGYYVAGYVIAAIIVSFIMCLLTLIIGVIYLGIANGSFIAARDTLEILFALLAIIFSSASFVFLCASFIHTNSAFNGLTTLLGTLIGFFAAIYVPYGNMPQTLKYIIRFLPAFQGASAIREIWMNQELQWFHCPSEIKTGYADYMGLTISFGNATLSPHMKILYMFISGLIFLGLATAILSRKRQQER